MNDPEITHCAELIPKLLLFSMALRGNMRAVLLGIRKESEFIDKWRPLAAAYRTFFLQNPDYDLSLFKGLRAA